MSDLSDIQQTDTIKIVGSSSTGVEGTPVGSDSLGNLNVALPSLISVNNSGSASLSAAQVFTGLADDVSQYSAITVEVFSTAASATAGFKAQYSVDATNWDDGDSYTIPANDGKYFAFPPEAQYFRIMYTNGASTATFRLQTILHRTTVIQSSHRIEDTLTGENDAQLVKAIDSARRIDGTYDNMKLSNNNELMIADVINNSGQGRAQNATTSAVEALGGATILSNRKFISITPTNGTVYWDFANTVTTSNGEPIFKNQTKTIAATANVHIYIIAASTVDCRIKEGS